jgi:hypothetical protein
MKTILPLIISLAALGAVAQTDPAPTPIDPVPPPAPAPPADFIAPVPTSPVAAGAASARAMKAIKRAAQNMAPAGGFMAQPVVPPPAPEKSTTATARKLRAVESDVILNDFAGLPRSAKTGRTLVVQTSAPDANAIADAEEDLSVMALILRKATGDSRGDDKRMAMGIEVFGSSSGARNMYVEGYGALFLLGVRFPLIAPPDKALEGKAKNEPKSEWDDALDEYRRGERDSFELQLETTWRAAGKIAGEEYDAEKVEELKTELLGALKNATHIRALKPDEFVTVVIQGAEAVRIEKIRGGGGGGTRAGATLKLSSSRRDSARGETVMTVRVKKSDVDSYAKGNLDPAGFRKKAAIQTYFRRGDSSVATSLFPTR